ncbi:IS1249 family transposase [Diaminobutyricibacter sp. McL0618]|uniref:IS1249 family transposase n=1 Tax=Leifsonia sp. McL0618 TaxID=3415677 RepID=UPI003CF31BDB
MLSPSNTTSCLVCAATLVKNGKTAAGTQRWRCPDCGASSVRRREDVTRRHQLVEFLTWLLGKDSQAEADHHASARTFRRSVAWCWDVQPRLGPVTTTHHQVLVDGVWVGSWCLLIAVTERLEVLAWQWCARESTAAWNALFERIPAPAVIVCDGGTGIVSALRQSWPETRMQRCLFHVQMNIRQHLTLNPRTDAGRRLLGLSRALSTVRTVEDAIQWQMNLDTWWRAHGHLTKERTIRDGRFWFTHDRLRKAWLLMRKLTRDDVLFTYLDYGNARTTSPLEGGINNGIRHVLRAHRGMSEAHMKRAAEWFLTLHEIPLQDAHQLITTAPEPEPEPEEPDTDDTDTPALYDSGLTADEGLWTRSGWAGRS